MNIGTHMNGIKSYRLNLGVTGGKHACATPHEIGDALCVKEQISLFETTEIASANTTL